MARYRSELMYFLLLVTNKLAYYESGAAGIVKVVRVSKKLVLIVYIPLVAIVVRTNGAICPHNSPP